MTTTSLAKVLATPPNEVSDAKMGRIPKRVRQAITLLVNGECKTQRAAAERVGLSENWISKALNRPAAQAFALRESRKTIRHGVMRASARLVELVDAESEHVSLEAATKVLAYEGIAPPESGRGSTVNISITPGYVIDLREPDEEPITIDADKSPPSESE